MRSEILLLVAGLTTVAALPLQELAASTLQDDLLKIILSAKPEGNELFPDDINKSLAPPTKIGEETSQQEMTEEEPQPQTEVKHPPKEQTQSQDSPVEEEQAQSQGPSLAKEQIKSEDPQAEQQTQLQDPSVEPETADTDSQTQEQPQVPDPDPSLPGGTGESSVESMVDEIEVRPEPKLMLVDPQEDLSIDLAGAEAAYFDSEMKKLAVGRDDDYVVLHVQDTPSQDVEGTFSYEPLAEQVPSDQEAGPIMFDPEEYPSEPQMDSISFESEPQMQPQSQMNPLPYNSEVPLDQEEPVPSYPERMLHYEEIPLNVNDGSDEHDYEFHEAAYQQNHEENMPLEPESPPSEDSSYLDYPDVPEDALSWLFPDFFNEEPTEYDESYYDYAAAPSIENQPLYKTGAVSVPQESDDAEWEELSMSEVNGATDFLDGSLLGSDGDVVIVEAGPTSMTDSSEEEGTDDVSLADFFIPTTEDQTYSGVSHEYSSPIIHEHEDEDEEFLSSDEETFPVDDGHVEVEPFLKSDLVQLEQDQSDTMFFGEALTEYNPPEDDTYAALWSSEGERGDQREFPEQDKTAFIYETQPLYSPDVESDDSYPSLREIMQKGAAADESAESWDDLKFFRDFVPGDDTMFDDSLLPQARGDLTEGSDNDAIEIITINDPMENSYNYPATQGQSTPMAWYPEDHHQQPYWMPYRSFDQSVPKIDYSAIDEIPRRRLSGSFGPINDLTFSPRSSNYPREAAVTEDPFSFMNEISNNEVLPPFLTSNKPSYQPTVKDFDSLFLVRNYPDTFTTPRVNFRDFLQSLNPSYYNPMNVNNVQRESPWYYPQSYNPFLRHNGLQKQYSQTSPPLPYSSSLNSIQSNDNLADDGYYPIRLERLSSYGNGISSGLFREDTMPKVHSHEPQRYYGGYPTNFPFMSSYSSSPRSLFSTYERPQYEGNAPIFSNQQYAHNTYYSTGPYHPTPIYPRYAPHYYY